MYYRHVPIVKGKMATESKATKKGQWKIGQQENWATGKLSNGKMGNEKMHHRKKGQHLRKLTAEKIWAYSLFTLLTRTRQDCTRGVGGVNTTAVQTRQNILSRPSFQYPSFQ